MKTYKATGFVYGKTWVGGSVAYPSKPLQAKTRGALIKRATQDLQSGVLDSGMGFENLKGALLYIEEVEALKINGKEYLRSEFDSQFIGELTDEEQDFLFSVL